MEALFEPSAKSDARRRPPDNRQSSVSRDGFGNTAHGVRTTATGPALSTSTGEEKSPAEDWKATLTGLKHLFFTDFANASRSGSGDNRRMWGMGNPEFQYTGELHPYVWGGGEEENLTTVLNPCVKARPCITVLCLVSVCSSERGPGLSEQGEDEDQSAG